MFKKTHPCQEVWTPLFLLANCETDLCYVIPHNRTNVGLENNGTVTFVVQIKQIATCVMNLKVWMLILIRLLKKFLKFLLRLMFDYFLNFDCFCALQAFPYDLERCRLIFYLADYKVLLIYQ